MRTTTTTGYNYLGIIITTTARITEIYARSTAFIHMYCTYVLIVALILQFDNINPYMVAKLKCEIFLQKLKIKIEQFKFFCHQVLTSQLQYYIFDLSRYNCQVFCP
jgi:hypothetical protein